MKLAIVALLAALSSAAALRPSFGAQRVVVASHTASTRRAALSRPPVMSASHHAASTRRAALASLVLAAPGAAAFAAGAVDSNSQDTRGSKDKKDLDAETAVKWKAIYTAKSQMKDPKDQEK